MPRPVPSLKAKAVAYLAQREHSRIELRRKLLAWIARRARVAAASPLAADASAPLPADASAPLPGEAEVDALLDALAHQGLLSAERFVETRVHARAARFGNLRIRHELSQHGLELDPEQARTLAESEFSRARAVWTRRYGSPPQDAAERARQMRFLAARGFSADVVRRVVGGEAAEDEPNGA
jgi:regulatory protein